MMKVFPFIALIFIGCLLVSTQANARRPLMPSEVYKIWRKAILDRDFDHAKSRTSRKTLRTKWWSQHKGFAGMLKRFERRGERHMTCKYLIETRLRRIAIVAYLCRTANGQAFVKHIVLYEEAWGVLGLPAWRVVPQLEKIRRLRSQAKQ
jgi:hypothetical protein